MIIRTIARINSFRFSTFKDATLMGAKVWNAYYIYKLTRMRHMLIYV